MVYGHKVTLLGHGLDRYGRLIADVILPDGRSLTHELVKAGFAWRHRQYSGDLTLRGLQVEARNAKRGPWAEPNPVPPWEWWKARR